MSAHLQRGFWPTFWRAIAAMLVGIAFYGLSPVPGSSGWRLAISAAITFVTFVTVVVLTDGRLRSRPGSV
jgi:hypothetical protein